LFSAQHFMPFSQQPSFASATQQADLSLQQASFAVQQSAVLTAVFVVPQQALAIAQQAEPSRQHLGGAEQHSFFSAQQLRPFSQQPNLASATQQALFSLQQASLAEQQSRGSSPVMPIPVNRSAKVRNEPANNLVNMELISSDFAGKHHCLSRGQSARQPGREAGQQRTSRVRVARVNSARHTGERVMVDVSQ
jgi:hypothetical protein